MKKKTVTKKHTHRTIKKTLPTIFVQIAAYRDPELGNTIQDALAHATHPDRLKFAIAWQHSPYDEWDTLTDYVTHPQFDILDIDYRDAKGVCYARHLLNQKYSGETYTLQLDSHHRFAPGWDETLVAMLEGLRTKDCPKPLLSSYLPSFDPSNYPASRLEAPWVMEFDRFAPEGVIHFLPHTIDDYKELDAPIPTRFISGHFIFTDGKFCVDVPYDPEYYFHGEEINMSVRAYMAGYDLFAPHRAIIWHEYTRRGKVKHWDDHTTWASQNTASHARNRRLFGIDGITGDDTLTTHVRSLREYELYAGIEFATRRVHTKTIQKLRPPISGTEDEHVTGLTNFQRVCVDVYKKSFAQPADDYTFWAVAFEDATGKEIYRQDASAEEIRQLLSTPYETDKFVHIWRTFYSEVKPRRWVVWPQSKTHGFMERLTGEIPE